MWCDVDTENSNKILLIDQENSIFPNNELTKKGSHYTITFLPQDAEKFNNQDHVYYFSKSNNKFSLKPEQKQPKNSKNEIKVFFSTKAANERGEFTDYCFQRVKYEQLQNPFLLFYINENHPRIKELLSQGKLQQKKQFIIRYGKVDNISGSGLMLTFDEFNQELEITEA